MMHRDLIEALEYLRPGATFNLVDDVIEWTDEQQTQPTSEELTAAIALIDVWDLRRDAYAPIGDQLDNITKALKFLKTNSVNIGPDGDVQLAMSDAVKARYPKP